MDSRWVGRRRITVAGGAVLIVVGAFTAACGTSGNQAPSTSTTTTTTTTTTTPAPPPTSEPAPTEKSINPTGGNLFTPPVVAPPAPNVPGGQHPGINGVS
jgi:hypothetical protein